MPPAGLATAGGLFYLHVNFGRLHNTGHRRSYPRHGRHHRRSNNQRKIELYLERKNKSVGGRFCYTIVTDFRKSVAIPLLSDSTKLGKSHNIKYIQSLPYILHRKISPNTTDLYSDASILPRILSAAFHISLSKPISAVFMVAIMQQFYVKIQNPSNYSY